MPVERIARPEDIQAALPTVMADHDALDVYAVVAALREGGLKLPRSRDEAADEVFEALDAPGPHQGLFIQTDDDEIVDVRRVMDGRTFTHRLSPREVAADGLVIDADLPGMAFDHLHATGLTLADGATVGVFNSEPDGHGPLTMALPDGTYAGLGVGAGDLVGVAFSGGVARLVAVPALDPTSRAAAEVAEAVRQDLLANGPAPTDRPADVLLLTTEHFRAPVAPLTEILGEHGLHTRGEVLAASAEQADQVGQQRMAHQLEEEYECTPSQAQALAELIEMARQAGADLVDDIDPTDTDLDERLGQRSDAVLDSLLVRARQVDAGLAAIADPWLARAVADQALTGEEMDGLGLATLAEVLRRVARTGRRDRARDAGLDYLIGRGLEAMGDPLAAEPMFQRAAALDHPYALLSLAGIAADRGQPEAALSLLDRSGAPPQHPLRTALATASQPAPGSPAVGPARKVGRNEPCWCGSGRKFKACHARASSAPLEHRARPLLGRVAAWLSSTQPGSVRAMVSYAMMITDGRVPIAEVAQFVPDVLLIEGGGLEDYVALRAPLLPADEALLAQQWAMSTRSVYEVEAGQGEQLTLRDLLTGERVRVAPHGADPLRAGQLIVTRVADAGGHLEVFGGVTPISLGQRQFAIDLLADEPDPMSVIDLLAARWKLPSLQTAEGSELVLATSTLRTTAPARLRGELDDHFEPAGNNTWHLLEPRGGGERILATLELDGRELKVSAMSAERLALVLEVLDGLRAKLVETDYDLQSPLSGAPTPSDSATQIELSQDPEAMAAVAQYIAKAEREWVDERIPALDGLTPRQALNDPTRRGDLISLLATFPSDNSPLEMDGGRIRALLGLADPQ